LTSALIATPKKDQGTINNRAEPLFGLFVVQEALKEVSLYAVREYVACAFATVRNAAQFGPGFKS